MHAWPCNCGKEILALLIAPSEKTKKKEQCWGNKKASENCNSPNYAPGPSETYTTQLDHEIKGHN